MKKSVWTDSVTLPSFPKADKETKTEVLIIGGGICGILCAYMLEQKGVDYILVEGSRIGYGITKNTTAKITSQHGLIYHKLIKSVGREKAQMYLSVNEKALREYKLITENIDCDFETKDAYVYSINDRKKIEDEVRAVNSLGFNAEFASETSLPFKTAGAVKFKDQAQFNPMKFLNGIVKGLNIYENTFITDINENWAKFDGGKIIADKIIVTTHFPFINKHGSYFIKMYQKRSYVIAFENADNVGGMYIDEAENGMSFRNYEDLLLIGGGGHRTGKQGGNWKEIKEFSEKYYPEAKERYYWAAQDCMSLDQIPYIGRYSKTTPNLYVATGFNKWGMTSSMAAAEILADLVVGKSSEYETLFNPSRNILKPQLFVNGFEAITNLLTPTLKRCPHLGCALKWNKAEHTWDCPCHGSRFEKNGDLIDNPATGGIDIG